MLARAPAKALDCTEPLEIGLDHSYKMLLIFSMIKTIQTFLDCSVCCRREERSGVVGGGMIILKDINDMVRESGWLSMTLVDYVTKRM
jgi:hypothetical protein